MQKEAFDPEERVGDVTSYVTASTLYGEGYNMGEIEFYMPMAGASDMADAIPNGCMVGIPSITSWTACWAHVWRAIHKNLKKLDDSSDDKVSVLFNPNPSPASNPTPTPAITLIIPNPKGLDAIHGPGLRARD